MKKRVTVVFDGHVQGVGFRFTTVSVATDHAVTGFVQNLADGSVRLVAEGAEEELKRFLSGVRSSAVGRFIRSENAEWGAATGEFTGFDVLYF